MFIRVKFYGDKPITREEMAVIATRCKNYKMRNWRDWDNERRYPIFSFKDSDEIDEKIYKLCSRSL